MHMGEGGLAEHVLKEAREGEGVDKCEGDGRGGDGALERYGNKDEEDEDRRGEQVEREAKAPVHAYAYDEDAYAHDEDRRGEQVEREAKAPVHAYAYACEAHCNICMHAHACMHVEANRTGCSRATTTMRRR